MAIAIPDWLTARGGALACGPDGQTWLVLLDGTPQYKLTPVPVGGQFGCQVAQTVNGKRLDKERKYATADDAIKGGMEELRAALGW